jgi:hypothetical protein
VHDVEEVVRLPRVADRDVDAGGGKVPGLALVPVLDPDLDSMDFYDVYF